jgi:hypothetical protein
MEKIDAILILCILTLLFSMFLTGFSVYWFYAIRSNTKDSRVHNHIEVEMLKKLLDKHEIKLNLEDMIKKARTEVNDYN